MGHRLTTIVTKTGDGGETGLVGNKRVSKDSPRVWAIGAVDELNSAVGLARAFNADRRLDRMLARVQNDLFDLGAELATPPGYFMDGMPQLGRRHVAALEKLVAKLNAEVGPLTEFILPTGTPVAALLHVARTHCRRAERYCVRLAGQEPLGKGVVPYLNRLGDALFVLARWVNHQAGRPEACWVKRSPASRQSGRSAR